MGDLLRVVLGENEWGKTVILTVRAILYRCVWRRREGKNTQFVFSNVVKYILFFRWTSTGWDGQVSCQRERPRSLRFVLAHISDVFDEGK